MKTIIEDTWFSSGTTIRIGQGGDDLHFVRCCFNGGRILIEPGVRQEVFSRCIFRGTRFTGQPLSEQIATGCRILQPETEESGGAGILSSRFSR